MHRPDTGEDIQKVYDEKIRQLSEEARFMKGLSLTHLCRKIVLAEIRNQNLSLTSQEIKNKFQKLLYGN